jgi:ABC-type lipoprotein release transport system permease subunit
MISPFQIAYKNLLRDRVRTLLTFSGIMLASWVLASLLGFNRGYERALDHDIDNMGYQLMVMAKGCPYEAATLMLQGGTGLRYIEQSMVDSIAKEPEVEKATPILMQAFFDPNKGKRGDRRVFRRRGCKLSRDEAVLSFPEGRLVQERERGRGSDGL